MLRHIFDEPEVAPAPLGVRPTFPLVRTDAAPATSGMAEVVAPATRAEHTEVASQQPALPLSHAVEAAISASEAARARLPLEDSLLRLRESLQAVAVAMSGRVHAHCRATVCGIHAADSPQAVGDTEDDLARFIVTPVATSATPDLCATRETRLADLTDLTSVFRNSLAVFLRALGTPKGPRENLPGGI